MRVKWLIGGLILLALGCGGSNSKKLAPVSGVVMLDGKPLRGAYVQFEPVENDNGPNRAPTTSAGKTDDNGAYSLAAVTGEKGAVVGKHTVRISLPQGLQPQDTNTDARPKRRAAPTEVEKLPARYNGNSELTCDVPPEGRTNANFDLKSR
jgi:hypothetical protein